MSPRLLVAGAIVLAACSGGSDTPDATPQTVCTDGFDNDGDGSIDYPADPGCATEIDTDESNDPIAMCSDGRDNDGDGKIDYPNDPGCFLPLQNSESDDCPDGPGCPQCSNGIDDNDDAQIDFPNDDGCSTAADGDEYLTDPNACGTGLTVTRLESTPIMGTLPGAPSLLSNTECGGGGGEVPYEIVITEPKVIVVTTEFPETTTDTSVYVRTQCLVESSELGCNDNATLDVLESRLTVSLPNPGVYYLIVDARTLNAGGMFKLDVDFYNGEGTECTTSSECGPGLQCRIPIGGTDMICTSPVCDDGVDDDGDGLDDYPDDPGCTEPGDFDEVDDCPAGPTCPDCANGVDDDGDGDTDFPADVDCSSAAQPVEGCSTELDPIAVQTTATSTGTNVGASNDFDPFCDFSSGGPDVVTLVQLPDMQTFHVDDAGTSFTAVLTMHDDTCANELQCDLTGFPGGEAIDIGPLAAGNYAIVVDSYFGGQGNYQLNISGTIAPLGACDGALATNGVISCPVGYGCIGGVCLGNLECNNGTDDDGDGEADYPDDPGCAGPTDTTEADDCPSGPNCPQCGNNVDDDGDSDTDYPDDVDCDSAADDDENPPTCTNETDPVNAFTGATSSGSTVGFTNDFFPTCAFNTGPDLLYTTDLPAMQSFHVDNFGTSYDSVLAMYDPACVAQLGCEDSFSFGNEQIDLTNLAAGTYNIVIDGYNGNAGPYNLAISGVIAPLGACDGALASAGVIACPTGYACTGGVCLGTQQCNNGVDNDGDTKIDYPLDPGCATPEDNTETDTCPGGATCPECANTVDDDGDGDIDYPADSSCAAASGAEGTCGQDAGGLSTVVIPSYAGSTLGGVDDFTPTCATFGPAQDRAFALNLPIDVSQLRVDTVGSAFDTVLSIMDAECTGVLGCDDQSGGGSGTSLVTLFDVPAGAYGIIVDGWSGDGDYVLNIRGTAYPGGSCTSPLFSTGVLVCPSNHICTAGTCQPL
jgi:large repetitive protein